MLVVKNEDSTRGLMTRVRSYREGRFENLAWDNVGMRAVWRTRKFSGYISDYNLGDFDNDGQDEVFFVVVKKVGDPMTGDAKATWYRGTPTNREIKMPSDGLTQSSCLCALSDGHRRGRFEFKGIAGGGRCQA